MRLPAPVKRLASVLSRRAEKLGFGFYLVGGIVRDTLLGKPCFDLDFVVEGDPIPLAEEAGRYLDCEVSSFDRFGTLRLKPTSRLRLDFAAARRESYPEPASLPVVERPVPIAEDLGRRDFAINALAFRLWPGPHELIDLFGGLEDLRSGIVRPLHQDSFSDDPTRVFRAARYISRLGFRPSSILLWQVKQALENGWAARLSPHRITQEILRVLAEPNPALAMGLLKRWGYLGLAHPVLAKFHGWKGCPKADVPVRLAWLSARLGPKHGAEFLSALAFSRELAAPAREVLDLLARRTSPRTPLSTPARAALKLAYPDLPAQALTPAFISGGDLKALGVLAGPDMGRLLDKQARLQWQGRLKSRSQALSWAEKKL